jgi:hypothetical protein
VAGDVRAEQSDSGRAYSPVYSNPQFSALWNMADIRALNHREQAPPDFYSPGRAFGVIAGDASSVTSLPDASDLLQSLQAAENLAGFSVEKHTTESRFEEIKRGTTGNDQRNQMREYFRRQADECQQLANQSQIQGDDLLAQAPNISIPANLPDIASSKSKPSTDQISQGYGIDYTLKHAKQQAIEDSHKKFDGKDAKSNDEFLDMFLNGSGNDRRRTHASWRSNIGAIHYIAGSPSHARPVPQAWLSSLDYQAVLRN